ncbi:MAG: hypothetical protein HFF43_02390 [Lawsonibacter sp.]|jgi:hypothetical protein|nr:hypothetical protein [Lawsonibacter sp.]
MLILMGLCLSLSGCALAAVWLDGCGSPDADLVVVNDSRQEVWSIELDYGDETCWVRNAQDHALLKPGQTYGLELEGARATVVLSDRNGGELGRKTVDFSGERLYVTLEEDKTISVTEEMPDV